MAIARAITALKYRANRAALRVRLARAVRADARRLQASLATGRRRGLFIDCGSNCGQGFAYFSRHFSPEWYDYLLIEPNPSCLGDLQRIRARWGERVDIITAAASCEDGEARFFGLEGARDTSDGGSLLQAHNNAKYLADPAGALIVRTFALSALIGRKRTEYPVVVLKMDIEGAEYDVLEDLARRGVHRVLDALYVEFHSEFMQDPERDAYSRRETRLLARYREDGVPVRLWL